MLRTNKYTACGTLVVVLTILFAVVEVDSRSECLAQPSGCDIQCPYCGGWIPLINNTFPSRCPKCGRSFSGGGGSGGGGGASEEYRRPTALDQALEDIDNLNTQLTPWRQKRQQEEQEISAIQDRLRLLRGGIAKARLAAADANAQKLRQQKILNDLSERVKFLREQIEKRTQDLNNSLARIAALQQGRVVSPLQVSGDVFSPPPAVSLDEKDLYGHINPADFLTRDIYQQALRERDRQAALRKDLKERLARMERWGVEQDARSEEFQRMLRSESAGVMSDMLDVVAPMDRWLESAKVGPELLRKYKVAYAAMRSAVAACESARAANQVELEAKLNTSMSGFLEVGKEIMGAGLDEATRNQMGKAIVAYEAMSKYLLATSPVDCETKARLFCDAVAALNPYVSMAKGVFSLTERAVRQRQILIAMEEFSDQRKTMKLLRRRLAGKIESLDVNIRESQRIIDLWDASHARAGRL